MFLRVAKEELDVFNYNNEDDVKSLVPLIMIKAGHMVYGDDWNVTISIEQMWNIVTKGKRKLRKTQCEVLVQWFNDYIGEELDYTTEYTFESKSLGYYDRVKNYIKFEMKHVLAIFNEYRFDNIGLAIALTLRTLAHMNGDYIGMSHDDLLNKILHSKNHEVYSEEVDFEEETDLWFKYYTVDELLSMSRKFVAYPNIENDLLVRRYDNDENPFDKPFLSEQNFNKHIEKLEKIGVICKVNTTYGQRKNKVVFCQVEHKEICMALYKRYEDMIEFAKQEKAKQPKQPKVKEIKKQEPVEPAKRVVRRPRFRDEW